MPDPKPHHRRTAAEALNPTPDNTTQVAIDHWVACGEWMSRSSLTRFYPTQLRHERTAQAIADAEERGRQRERLHHLDLTRRFLRALIVLTCEKPEHWGALREECEEVLAGTVEEFTERPVAAKIRGGFEMLLDEFQKGLSENKGGQQVTNTSAWQGAKLIPSLAREMRWYIKNYGPILGIVIEPDALLGEQPGRLIGGGK